MALTKWDYTLNLSRLNEIAGEEATDESAAECGKYVAKQIRAHKALNEAFPTTMAEIADDFEDVYSVDDFDFVFGQLYDWADVNRRVWVKTDQFK